MTIKCRQCAKYKEGWCEVVADSPDPDIERECRHGRIMTNGDFIRRAADRELAWLVMCPRILMEEVDCRKMTCFDCTLKWLQEPHEEETK